MSTQGVIKDLAATLAVEAVKGMQQTAERPNDLSPRAVEENTAALRSQVEASIIPTLEYKTNNEPWWRSNVMYGAVAAIGAGATGFYAAWEAGVRDWEMLAPFVMSVVGGLYTLYGRFIATKALGA